MNFTSVAGITAIGAIIATTWRQIAQIGRYIIGLFIGTSVLKDKAGEAVQAFVLSKAIKSPLGMRTFGGYESYVHPKQWFETVGYEGLTSDPVIIKYGKQYALLSLVGAGNQTLEGIGGVGNRHVTVKLKYLRWFFNIEKFTTDALDYYNAQKRQTKETDKKIQNVRRINRFKIVRYSGNRSHGVSEYGRKEQAPAQTADDSGLAEEMVRNGVYRLLKWSREDLQLRPPEGHSPFDGYPFPKEITEAIKELDQWLAHEKWFRSKSIPWRRGWGLHGPPGTGKSTLVRAIGMAFDLPVYIFDLAGMDNEMLVQSWDEMLLSTPCIALIEDIDNIFNGRKFVGSSITSRSHVTFDCLLNCISGVKQSDGVFLIITTNHIETLDPALGIPDVNGKSSRPGRIDKVLKLGFMEEEQRIVLAKHILSDYPELVNEAVKAGEGETAAQFQARCAQIALDRFWTDGKKLAKDGDRYEPVLEFKPSPVNSPTPAWTRNTATSPAKAVYTR